MQWTDCCHDALVFSVTDVLGGGAGAAWALRRLALRRLRRRFPGAPVSAAYVGVLAVVSFGSGAGGDGVTTSGFFLLWLTTVQSLCVSLGATSVGTLGSGACVAGVGMMVLGSMAAVASSLVNIVASSFNAATLLGVIVAKMGAYVGLVIAARNSYSSFRGVAGNAELRRSQSYSHTI